MVDYSGAVRAARHLKAERILTHRDFMLVLNTEAGRDPDRIRRAAAILHGLMISPNESDDDSRR